MLRHFRLYIYIDIDLYLYLYIRIYLSTNICIRVNSLVPDPPSPSSVGEIGVAPLSSAHAPGLAPARFRRLQSNYSRGGRIHGAIHVWEVRAIHRR